MTGVRTQVMVDRRPARAADLPALRTLFADAHLELACLPTDTRFLLVDMQFRAQRRQHAGAHPQATHEMLVVDGRVVGRLVVDRATGPLRLVDISIELGHRREGIAHTVLAELCAEADAAGRALRGTVWSGNAPALALLAGFRVVGHEGGWLTLEREAEREAG